MIKSGYRVPIISLLKSIFVIKFYNIVNSPFNILAAIIFFSKKKKTRCPGNLHPFLILKFVSDYLKSINFVLWIVFNFLRKKHFIDTKVCGAALKIPKKKTE